LPRAKREWWYAAMPGATWSEGRDPIDGRVIACLRAEGYSIAGERSAVRAPDPSRGAVLIFDVDTAAVERAAALERRCSVRLVGLTREGRPGDQPREPGSADLSAVLVLRALTPSRLLTCLRAVSEGSGSLPAELSHREFDVLRLLADGDSTRDIAKRLSYSERTVKNIVHDVLVKLNCRTRAHAVALAARRGVI
jgi:DNA-binding CsgD family transcriptional regulator